MAVTNVWDLTKPNDAPVPSMFKVQPAKATPCDFDGRRLLLLEHNGDETKVRVLYLQTNTCLAERTFGRTHFRFFRCKNSRGASCVPANKCTHAKFFGENDIVYVMGFRSIHHAQLLGNSGGDDLSEVVHVCPAADICSLDASDPTRVSALSTDGRVWVFMKSGGSRLQLVRVAHFKGATFSFGYPYFVKSSGEACCISADEGVFFCDHMTKATGMDVPGVGKLGDSPGPMPVLGGDMPSGSGAYPPTQTEPPLSRTADNNSNNNNSNEVNTDAEAASSSGHASKVSPEDINLQDVQLEESEEVGAPPDKQFDGPIPVSTADETAADDKTLLPVSPPQDVMMMPDADGGAETETSPTRPIRSPAVVVVVVDITPPPKEDDPQSGSWSS